MTDEEQLSGDSGRPSHMRSHEQGGARSLRAARAKGSRRRSSAATIHDVALRAGVSSMTVSRVVNGDRKVSAMRRRLVLRAVRDLNYTPNPAARTLAAAHELRFALIYTNPSSAYLSELLVGALGAAARIGVQLVLDRWDHLTPAAQAHAARNLSESVGGVILPPPLCESQAVCAELAAAGVPVVAIASGRLRAELSGVRIDYFYESREITEHLLAKGHTRIAFIKGHPNQSASALRYDGFRSALRSAGVRLNPALIAEGHFTYRSGLEASAKLLALKAPPTAIFASNDDMAAAAISVAHRTGREVPRDLSVVGFDDTPIATAVWPELTTVRQPIAAMAESAIELLLRGVRERKERRARVDLDEVFAHTLVKRGSVAAPRHR